MTTAPGSNSPALDPASKSMDDIVALAKRRGFVYPASEIYGGINGFWDYGPLGAALKNNIRDHWWKLTVECPPLGPDGNPVSIVGLDSSIIQNPKTWEASGHVGGFSDPMVDDTETKQRFRADHLIGCFVADRVSKDSEEWIALQKDFQDSMLNGELPKKWELLATAIGSITEAHAHFCSLKKIGTYKVIRGSQSVEYHDGGISTAQMSIRLEDSSGGRPLVNIMPILPSMIMNDREKVPSPFSGKMGKLTEPREFNLMFETFVGAIRNDEAKAYLRPETAQGIFLNYKNVLDTMRVKVPFGIAQIGKSFRNEVTPRNFIFRSREFEQMEMEWFCAPEDAAKWYEFWKHERMNWWKTLGIAESNLRFRDHDDDELAHYSKMCVDVEYKYPFTAPGFGELEGVAHRGCFDLTQHQEHSGKDLTYFDQERQVALQSEGVDKDEIKKRSRYIPNVIEPASGLTRAVLVLLCEAYTPTPDRKGASSIMKFDPKFAPVKAGIFPVVNKDGMPEVAQKLYMELREKHAVEFDVKQSIGKRYARMDEIGTPYCIAIDGDSVAKGTVTVRDRDTTAQETINLDQVEAYLADKIG